MILNIWTLHKTKKKLPTCHGKSPTKQPSKPLMPSLHGLPAILCNTGGTLSILRGSDTVNRRHLHHHRNLVCSADMAPKCGQIIMTSLHGLPAILCNTGGTLSILRGSDTVNRRHLHHHRYLVCADMAPNCGQIIMTSLHGLLAILCNTGGTLSILRGSDTVNRRHLHLHIHVICNANMML